MTTPSPAVSAALLALRSRWGAAAPRPVGEVVGSLAVVPLPEGSEDLPRTGAGSTIRTGFAALDAILGPGGLPRAASVGVRGDGSSGATTLALRLIAEAQAAGAIVVYLDLARSFDPVEAVARGVRPEWLAVLAPSSLDEGLAMAGWLLAARAVDTLVLDLPTGPIPGAGRVADRLHRLAALARRAGALLIVLEPPGLASGVAAVLGESLGVRLELARRSWIRLGRDVVGQRTEVVVARDRAGPPGRRADLRILYADGGDRDACLPRDHLLHEPLRTAPDATSPPLLAPSSPPPRPRPSGRIARLVPERTGGPGRAALDGRDRPRRVPGGALARRPARDGARHGPPAGAGGGLPRPGLRG